MPEHAHAPRASNPNRLFARKATIQYEKSGKREPESSKAPQHAVLHHEVAIARRSWLQLTQATRLGYALGAKPPNKPLDGVRDLPDPPTCL